MLRSDIKNICNELAKIAHKKNDCDYLNLGLMDLYNYIFNYCKESKTRPRSHKYDISHGCLYIDGIIKERFANLIPKAKFDPYAYYLEGKILAANEIID